MGKVAIGSQREANVIILISLFYFERDFQEEIPKGIASRQKHIDKGVLVVTCQRQGMITDRRSSTKRPSLAVIGKHIGEQGLPCARCSHSGNNVPRSGRRAIRFCQEEDTAD
jgi:hypothetical protein